MARHAGFAASIAIRQETLQQLVRVLHHANRIDHWLSGSWGGTIADMFLDVPGMECAVANGDRLALVLTAWGALTITPPGNPPETRQVLFRARVLASPKLSIVSSKLVFQVEGLTAELAELDIDPIVGGPFSLAGQAYLESDGFHDLVQFFIRLKLASMSELAPPLDLSFLGAIASAPGNTVTARVLDEALAMGIDVSGGGVTTHGNAAMLTDTTVGLDIAMWTNPAALPVVTADARAKITQEVTDNGATLQSLTITAEEGHLHVAGHADKGSDGSVDFSLNEVPRLVRPGHHEEWDEEYGEHFEINTPPRDELWFETTDVTVNVNRPWWAYLLDALGALFTFGIGTLIVEAIVAMVRSNISSGISSSGGETVAARTQEFTLEGIAEPTIRLRIERWEVHVEGLFTGILFQPQFRAPAIDGPRYVAAEQALSATLRWTLRLPFDAHPEDPQLFVRWTVRRTDTNAILLTQDLQAGSSLVLDLSGAPYLLDATSFKIAARVYRVIGPISTDLYSAWVAFDVTDVLDRSHPYVFWSHQVYTPNVRVEADGTKTILGYTSVERTSDLHRTALPGRCLMVSRYSHKVSRTDDGSTRPHLEYLDALPFPRAELVPQRARVCDYCFFGGPTKTTPLIP